MLSYSNLDNKHSTETTETELDSPCLSHLRELISGMGKGVGSSIEETKKCSRNGGREVVDQCIDEDTDGGRSILGFPNDSKEIHRLFSVC